LLRGLGNVIVKEVKELIRDPKVLIGMIIFPILLLPSTGLAVRISVQTAKESVEKISIGVFDEDGGNMSQMLIGFLSAPRNVTVVTINATRISEAINYVQGSNITALIAIPRGFSENITREKKAELKIYTVFRGTGIAESAGASAVSALVGTFENYLIGSKISQKFPETKDVVLNPIEPVETSIVKGKEVPVSPSVLFNVIMSQYIGMPLGVTLMIFFAMQIAATSVASEKEEKTLETLLTLPINRFTILVGKLAGSILVAAISALAYIASMNYYMGSYAAVFPTQAGVDLAYLGLAPTLPVYLIMGASLFVSLLSALALAVAISSFAEDVRSAQTFVGYIYPALFIPMIFLMYADINALPSALRLILLAIPYTHPMLAARTVFTEDYTAALFGIVYVSIFTVAVLYIAARIFTTEKILTMKLRLRRQKPKREE